MEDHSLLINGLNGKTLEWHSGQKRYFPRSACMAWHHSRRGFNLSVSLSSYLSHSVLIGGFWKPRGSWLDNFTSISMELISFHFIRSSKAIHLVCRGERVFNIHVYLSRNSSTLNLEETSKFIYFNISRNPGCSAGTSVVGEAYYLPRHPHQLLVNLDRLKVICLFVHLFIH